MVYKFLINYLNFVIPKHLSRAIRRFRVLPGKYERGKTPTTYCRLRRLSDLVGVARNMLVLNTLPSEDSSVDTIKCHHTFLTAKKLAISRDGYCTSGTLPARESSNRILVISTEALQVFWWGLSPSPQLASVCILWRRWWYGERCLLRDETCPH